MVNVEESSCVPPGFRFHPTDEELVGYYLKKKVSSQKIDLDVIREVDLYRIEPWDLQEKCRMGYEEQNQWYFFSHKDKKYPTGTRTNRATTSGFWKATGRDKTVYGKTRVIGMRKTLVFYKGRAPNGQKTDWIMHEYRVEYEENTPPQEEGWVVCKAFRKRRNATVSKSTEKQSSHFFYDQIISVFEPSEEFMKGFGTSSIIPINKWCSEEVDNLIENTIFDQFESRSLPSPWSSLGLHQLEGVSDWRSLDKFVASQLSQGGGNGAVRIHQNKPLQTSSR